MKQHIVTALLLFLPCCLPTRAQSPRQITLQDVKRAKELVTKMTLDEKISLISGNADGMSLRAIPRLGIPALQMHDGPQGIGQNIKGTCFPCDMLTAATWDRNMARLAGESLATDFRRHNTDVVPAPGVNIYRNTLCGRNSEYFGEDPYLTGETAKHYILGVQSKGVIAAVKHFATNDTERGRADINSNVDLRTLNEIYLAAFRKAVTEAGAGAVSDSRNRLYGLHATESRYLNIDLLRKKWGFKGIVMSDWGAVHSTVAAANGGLDLEMPTAEYWKPELIKDAMDKGLVSESTINEKVQHILQTMSAFGVLDKDSATQDATRENPELKAAALKIAENGITLLKNEDNTLPIVKQKFAVLGPNANTVACSGGGKVNCHSATTPWQGLKRTYGKLAHFIDPSTYTEPVDANGFKAEASSEQAGFRTEFFKNAKPEGKPAATAVQSVPEINDNTELPEGMQPTDFSARWTSVYTADENADVIFNFSVDGGYRMFVDDKPVCDEWHGRASKKGSACMSVEKGKAYNIRIEYRQASGRQKFTMDTHRINRSLMEKELSKYGTAVVVAGFDSDTESEGGNRTFNLPAGQDQLISNVAKTVKNVVVVINSGGGIDFKPWINSVKGIIMSWYPGEEGGTALADIISGKVNPSGKLPISIERNLEDNPAHGNFFPTCETRETTYKEGLFCGYRGYDKAGKSVMFPFGFGLSYTTFAYSGIKAVNMGSNRVRVSFKVKNTGTRAGDEVAQLYVKPVNPSVARPVKELKGYEKIHLEKGEAKTITIDLDKDAFSYYDIGAEDFVPDNCNYRILVGPYSDDLPLQIDAKPLPANDFPKQNR